MLKVYGIHGRTAAIIKIPFNHGKGSIECEFENGLIGQGTMNVNSWSPDSRRFAFVEYSIKGIGELE